MNAAGRVTSPTSSSVPPTTSRIAPTPICDIRENDCPSGIAIGQPKSFIVPDCRNSSAATIRSTLFIAGASVCPLVTTLAIIHSFVSFGSQRLDDVHSRGARRGHQRREDRRRDQHERGADERERLAHAAAL